ncbi:DNA-binding transcriptional MerR regulator [Clostridium acetobutylicum]|uniref:HTH transcriptional regulator MerR family n=1 Tax=Clostridium acetobutylicum (strain ATCC 824 / DSM 792 / JCM 1419 / IAM 19013 / LMG 5710 / NBRC 13948 / NRRL B-527 / VKM B-1787 / 2291 / W) TaxID=272562 RepID=Q97TJ4_CLOAB|nr:MULTISPECIES: MerR family transcriptional regulator [Clostridium]AAK76852.1 HTH transcriptional regulator MerR family [Clostridium acetobutylicum ATCC 824]ADZ22889.1 HTH transcriptional regulator MerR family [Clostridium acetobutylicum EA 2018]AEI34848.1 MerR family transcriptional regulator [Clostridium acetobutylicum DSM 1731]AWV82394.1 MerR family transcriptional regulator [Clostridium acetobutylicum]MBC2395762.1 MerR family transcriptional regulator [Clostridium acetobutylicum]
MYYTISEVSKKINVSPHTLRFYAKEGLMPFVERSKSGIRMFKDEDFESLFMIECLKKSGMSIKDIKEFMNWCMQGDETIDQRLNMFRQQQERVIKQIAELKETLDLIKYKCWYYETAQAAGTCDIHTSLKLEDIPETIRNLKENMGKMYCHK